MATHVVSRLLFAIPLTTFSFIKFEDGDPGLRRIAVGLQATLVTDILNAVADSRIRHE